MTTFWAIFIKFFIVGGIGFGIDVALTWLLKDKWQWNKYTANTFGFSVGTLMRFFATKSWAFQDNNPNWLEQMGLFIFIALVGLAMVNGIIYLLNERWQLFKFYYAKIIAMFVFLAWNFAANYFFTFA
jgi:putative flippase GtrA